MPLDTSDLLACISPLFSELETICEEIGVEDDARDTMLLQLEQECVDICSGKVEVVRKCRADLQHELDDVEAEINDITSALVEETQYGMPEGNLKQQISVLKNLLVNLRLKKAERMKEIFDIEDEVARISAEIAGDDQITDQVSATDDISAKKLEEVKFNLYQFQKTKDLRLREVESKLKAIQSLSIVMSLNFEKIMAEIHPSLVDSAARQPSISNNTLAVLRSKLKSLREEEELMLSCGQIPNVSVKVERAAQKNGESSAKAASKAKSIVKPAATAVKEKLSRKAKPVAAAPSRVMPKRKASEKPKDVQTPASKVRKTAAKSTPAKRNTPTVLTRSPASKKATPVQKAASAKSVKMRSLKSVVASESDSSVEL